MEAREKVNRSSSTAATQAGTSISSQEHWDSVYRQMRPDELCWFAPHLGRSVELILKLASSSSARIIDVGAGNSTLADSLLAQGIDRMSILDVSGAALAQVAVRLGGKVHSINWYLGDVLSRELPGDWYDIWHDRGMFHFLAEPEARAAYVEKARGALKRGGHVVVAAFAPGGPQTSTGLPVLCYTGQQLATEFGEGFQLVESFEDEHVTPAGIKQVFTYCCLQRM